jgi:hypothetical protein
MHQPCTKFAKVSRRRKSAGAPEDRFTAGLWLENGAAGVGSGNRSFVDTLVQTLMSFCRSLV